MKATIVITPIAVEITPVKSKEVVLGLEETSPNGPGNVNPPSGATGICDSLFIRVLVFQGKVELLRLQILLFQKQLREQVHQLQLADQLRFDKS